MPKHKKMAPRSKQIVYLWGAGATQAEIDYLGAHSVNLLMRNNGLGEGVATRILRQLPKRWRSAFDIEQGADIEKLITLLVSSNVKIHTQLAETMRKLYFEDICASLAAAKVLTSPRLAIGLLEMHNIGQFKEHSEVLSGIITTNHDGLLQQAAHQVQKEVDLGVQFQSADITPASTPRAPILQLHGSFTWIFGLPITVLLLKDTSVYSADMVWLPPTISKESKSYPFNKLAGLAYELLSKQCDVLRIVGSALTQNDWNVLSMIFNAQRHRDDPRGRHAQATSPEADPFARSQVVDQAGRPLVLYHGTDAEFDVFERSDDIGFHFGPRETAEARLRQAGMRNGRLIPVHVAISNPLRLPDLHTWAPNPVLAALEDAGIITGEQADAVDSVDRETVRTLLASKGYDGIVYANKTEGGGDSYIAFRSEQVRNADKPIAPITATWEKVI